jgi:hypothetical protein
MEVVWADKDLVLAAADKWTAAQAECRAMNRHYWTRRSGLTARYRYTDGALLIRQRCGRRCGVARVADMNADGYRVSAWRPDYSEAPQYLLEKLGRIDKETRAELERMLFADIPIADVTDE